MPAKLSTTLKKLDLVSTANRVILQNFYEYLESKGFKSERHIINLLNLLISLDKFLSIDRDGGGSFTSINSKEQILTFLDHQQKDGKWVRRDRDVEGKYITTFNQNKRLLSIFLRWLFNRNKSEEDWETPDFLKFKAIAANVVFIISLSIVDTSSVLSQIIPDLPNTSVNWLL